MPGKSGIRILLGIVAMFGGLAVAGGMVSGAAPEAQGGYPDTVWALERIYWRDVEANDLKAYRELWHEDFLGWPSVSAAPVRKEHITDWITTQTSKGLSFKLVRFKEAAAQVSGNVVVACYWVSYRWVDAKGAGDEHTIRVIHTWVKTEKSWQIIGGMSMPKPDGEMEK